MFDSMIEHQVPSVYASAHGGHHNLNSKESYVSSKAASSKAINKILANSFSGEDSSNFQDLVGEETAKAKEIIEKIKRSGKENVRPATQELEKDSSPVPVGQGHIIQLQEQKLQPQPFGQQGQNSQQDLKQQAQQFDHQGKLQIRQVHQPPVSPPAFKSHPPSMMPWTPGLSATSLPQSAGFQMVPPTVSSLPQQDNFNSSHQYNIACPEQYRHASPQLTNIPQQCSFNSPHLLSFNSSQQHDPSPPQNYPFASQNYSYASQNYPSQNYPPASQHF